jgi:hypothetical protein
MTDSMMMLHIQFYVLCIAGRTPTGLGELQIPDTAAAAAAAQLAVPPA